MKANEVIKKVLDEHGEITEVYWVACGGSLIDLYPSHFLMTVESAKTSSGWHTAKELLVATPKKAGQAQPGCDVQPFRQYEGGCGGR